MNIFTLPDLADIRDTIADCLASLRIAPDGQHECIVERCLIPVTLLFKAGEMAGAAGPEERAVFAYFLSLLEAQAKAFVERPACAPQTAVQSMKHADGNMCRLD